MRRLSKIQIEGDTEFSKEKITQQLIKLIIGRLTVIKREIQGIKDDLNMFQKRFVMSNDMFLEEFHNGTLGDDNDFFVWKGSLKLLKSLIEEENMLRDVL